MASVPEGEGAGGAATGGTAGQPAEPAPTFQPHTPESLARGQAADAFRDGIRRGDDLPGRGPWGPAQALLDAILGRGPRPAFAGARAGGGARGGRPLFDEGGGVFSPKKGGSVLEARAAGTGGTGGGRVPTPTNPRGGFQPSDFDLTAIADSPKQARAFQQALKGGGTRRRRLQGLLGDTRGGKNANSEAV